jgi:D-inositol-3-phosphate glycosyltransferase
MATSDRIAMLSIHSSPLGRLGSMDTGGMSVYLLELATELGKRGRQVDIFTRETEPGMAQLIDYAANVRIINLAIGGTKDLYRSALLTHLHRYRHAIETFCRQSGFNYQVIHSNYWLSGIVGDQLKAVWQCPHVITFHTLGNAKIAARKHHQEDLRRIYEEARLLQCCDGVIVPTYEERERLLAMKGGNRSRLYIVPLGVNLEHFKPDECVDDAKLADRKDNPVVLFAGRFDPMKGVEMAVKAMRLLSEKPEAHLLLVGGDGSKSAASKKLEHVVNELRMNRQIHFHGAVDYQQMPHYYRKADAVVVSSYYESFGMVILEALASGTPVAATAVGIAPHVIQPGINGYLAADTNEHSLADAITGTLELARQGKGQNIRRSICDYSWTRVAGSMLDVYSDVLLYS